MQPRARHGALPAVHRGHSTPSANVDDASPRTPLATRAAQARTDDGGEAEERHRNLRVVGGLRRTEVEQRRRRALLIERAQVKQRLREVLRRQLRTEALDAELRRFVRHGAESSERIEHDLPFMLNRVMRRSAMSNCIGQRDVHAVPSTPGRVHGPHPRNVGPHVGVHALRLKQRNPRREGLPLPAR